MNFRHKSVLENLSATPGGRRLTEISEPYRQAAIDLGMMEPALVDVDGPLVHITDAGREARAGAK